MIAEGFVAGIDLGGTEIKARAMASDGTVLAEASAATRDGEFIEDRPAFLAGVDAVVESLRALAGRPLLGVGICAPGLADRAGRRIWHMPGRMEGLTAVDWGMVFPDSPVRVLNDAHAALMGECWLGAARGESDVFMLTFGTGVGGAILSRRQLVEGAIGRAGHLGHLSIRPDGKRGITGLPGTLEETLSNSALAEVEKGRWPTMRALFDAGQSGEPQAQRHWRWALDEVARGLAGLINVLDPACIILGGGLIAAGEPFFDDVREALARYEWRPEGHRVRLVPAELGASSGAVGAAFGVLAKTNLYE